MPSNPMTDDDLAAIERLLMHGVIGTDPANVSGATTDDVAESAIDLLAEVLRLQKERQGLVAEASWDELAAEMTEAEAENARLRAERAVMLDVIEAADEYATWGGKRTARSCSTPSPVPVTLLGDGRE